MHRRASVCPHPLPLSLGTVRDGAGAAEWRDGPRGPDDWLLQREEGSSLITAPLGDNGHERKVPLGQKGKGCGCLCAPG